MGKMGIEEQIGCDLLVTLSLTKCEKFYEAH
jgi:hypothetical protein